MNDGPGKKTKAEIIEYDRKITEKVEIEARKERRMKELDIAEKNKKKWSSTKYQTVQKKNKRTYNLKILYTIPKFAGDEVFVYYGRQKKRSHILVNDKVQYFNEKHPNHLKKGIIRTWKYDSSEPNVRFEVIFNDPPFIYEKNSKTKQLYKTNKKIKIIENVQFKNLRKIEGSGDLQIEVPGTSGFSRNSFNLRNNLEEADKDGNKKNNILKFYEILIFLKNIKLKENKKENKEENVKIILEALVKIHSEKKYIYNFFLEMHDKPKQFYKPTTYNLTKKIFKQEFINRIEKFVILFNKDKTPFLEELKKPVELKKPEFKIPFDFFDAILINFGEKTTNKKDEKNSNPIYKLDKKDFFINNYIDYYKFIQGVMKKESEINNMEFTTYDDKFNNAIKNFIKKKFIKNDIFHPQEVKIKYTNKTTADKTILYNTPNKLVEPTNDKVFTINKYSFIDTLTQHNDYIEKDDNKKEKEKIFIIEKIADVTPGIIKIKLVIDLNIKDFLTTSELINEDKGSSVMRMFGDIVSNIGNNLNCDVSRRNFDKNLDIIKEQFKDNVKKPEIPIIEEDKPEMNKSKNIVSIQKLSPTVSRITSSFQKAGNKSLKNIKIKKNTTLKNRYFGKKEILKFI